MTKFIGKNDIAVLGVEQIVRDIYKPSDEKTYENIDKLVSYIKTERLREFIDKLKEKSINFKNTDILSHKIDLNDIIYPYKYLSRGSYGATFLAKLKKDKVKKGKKKNINKLSNNTYLVVKYEIVRDRDYSSCQDEYIRCIDKNMNEEKHCKVKEIYCRMDSAFIEIYINKNFIEKLNCKNFAMFYAFFMCPTFKIILDKNGKYPTDEFLNKYVDQKRFCISCEEKEFESEKMHIFSVYEYIKGKTLADYIQSKEFSLKTLYQIFLQLFGALSIAQVPNRVYYNHNDLHCNNIMIQNTKLSKYSYVFPYEKTKNYIKSTKRAVIIDQGNASLIFRDVNNRNDVYYGVYGWYKKSISKVIKNYNSPYADIYRVITDSYYRMLDYNKYDKNIKILKDIINDLFSLSPIENIENSGFFGLFSNNSNNSNKKIYTICTDFIENENEVWFDRYVEYLEKNLSNDNFSNLMKKIEKITYEYAFNYFCNFL